MKTLLRTSGLVAALALASFASARGAFPQNGTCRTTCFNFTAHTITTVSWQTTESQCCSGTINPCPAGTTSTTSSFTPNGGVAKLCGPSGGA
ncbi:MAG TPA: hypothetical protein VIA62_09785 [Thermoanaerobaculia bacterium]|nr:hypothetical protein [Thermoanaerobaculia bacterium]